MGADEKIKVLVDEPAESGMKSALPSFARNAATRTVEISGETLRDNLKSFVSQFTNLLDGTPLDTSGVVIDEIELSLSVSASGGVELLGKVNASAQAGIKVKLKRK